MNLETTYMGLRLKNPLVPSASPLSKNLEIMRRLEDAGAAAIVMYSLFEEQITKEQKAMSHYMDFGAESHAEATNYFPEPQEFKTGPEEYLEEIRKAKEALSIPIIPSLNGISPGGWTDYAKMMEQAGADAIELNIYYIATDPNLPGNVVEERYLEVVRGVTNSVNLPVAVKVGPYFSSMAHMSRLFVDAGAKSLVLFNRFYEPDFDLQELEVVPSLHFSESHEMRLPLHWVAILYGRVVADFAITSGVHSYTDVLKAMMAGANVAQLASVLLRHGHVALTEILRGIENWMEENEYESIMQMRGSMSQLKAADPGAFERANYMRELQSYSPDPVLYGMK
jgi:dihydroorotate dehydrogenase (fumarate)